jgi:integrase
MRLFRKPSGVYYAEFERGKRRSLKTADPAEAKKLFTELKRQYLSGRIAEIRGECRATLLSFAKEYTAWASESLPVKSFKANRLALRKLIFHAGDLPLDQLNGKHTDAIIQQSRRDKLSTASINNYIRHAKSVMNKAVEWGYIRLNPLRMVKELPKERKPPRYISAKELSRFLAQIEDIDLRRIVVALVTTGRRRAELLRLEWADIDLEGRKYLIKTSKTHMSRHYPLSSGFVTVLDSIKEERQGRIFKRWEHPDTITHLVKEALIAAGFATLRLHDLRHTFASIYMESGGGLRSLQDLLGHTEYRTTEIYAHLSDDHLQEEIDRVKIGPVDLFG